MFKVLLFLLFVLILLGYVFSQPAGCSTTPQLDLQSTDNNIQSNYTPPPNEPTFTLEENIVNNMKSNSSINDTVSSSSFKPIMASTKSAYDFE